MIPFFVMLGGALLVLLGAVSFIKIINSLINVQLEAEDAYKKKPSKGNLKISLIKACGFTLSGLVIFFVGWFLGYSVRDNGFLLYKKIYPHEENIIAAMGENISENGSVILTVSGREYILMGEIYGSGDDLRSGLEKLTEREKKTFILKDDFAVLSEYRTAEKILDELKQKGYCEYEKS